MKLDMTWEQAEELDGLLTHALGELSHEIAATDNPGYRAELLARRERLSVVRAKLAGLLKPGIAVPDEALREMAHPGG